MAAVHIRPHSSLTVWVLIMTWYSEFIQKYVKSKKEFWRSLRKDIFLGFILGPAFILLIAKVLLNDNIDLEWWLVTLITSIFISWIGTLLSLWRNQPLNLISNTFKDLRSSFSGCDGLIQAEMCSRIIDIRNRLSNLSSREGEPWTYEDRINVAHSLLEGLEEVEKYWATATDPPYASSNTLDAFFRFVKEKLKDSDVRRLLVFPLDELLKNLKSTENQQNLLRFIKIHQNDSFSKDKSNHSKTNYRYQLRYWPAKTIDLRQNLNIQLPPVIVDMAIINDSVVFGQSINGDSQTVSGNGYVYSDPIRASMYVQAFENIWNKRKSDSFPPAQLEAYIDLMDMRGKVDQETQKGYFTEGGIEFYEQVICNVKNSKELRAIDVTTRTEDWLSKPEYLDFLEATIKSAQKNNKSYHGRVFVLREPLCHGAAQVFIEKVILPQIEASITIYIQRTIDMFDKNLAAVDCIFNSDGWGFYLLPIDNFQKENLFAKQNQIHPKYVDPFFRWRYDLLAKSAKFKCTEPKDCENPALFDYLTQTN